MINYHRQSAKNHIIISKLNSRLITPCIYFQYDYSSSVVQSALN